MTVPKLDFLVLQITHQVRIGKLVVGWVNAYVPSGNYCVNSLLTGVRIEAFRYGCGYQSKVNGPHESIESAAQAVVDEHLLAQEAAERETLPPPAVEVRT